MQFIAFFVHRAKRSEVATEGSDFRSIELFAPPAAARITKWLISPVRAAAGGANLLLSDIVHLPLRMQSGLLGFEEASALFWR